MALFIDTFVNKIDRKGRVSVPAPFRAALAGLPFHGIVALPSFKFKAVQCAGIDWMEGIKARLSSSSDLFSEEHDDLTMALFSSAKQLAFDGEGRVQLPEELAKEANITDVAAFVGRGEHFEIWEPKALERYRTEARKRALEKGRTVRSARADGQP
jgi:MraZ protein